MIRMKGKKKYNPKGGAVVFCHPARDELRVGVALCSDNDKFAYHVGASIAEQRAFTEDEASALISETVILLPEQTSLRVLVFAPTCLQNTQLLNTVRQIINNHLVKLY